MYAILCLLSYWTKPPTPPSNTITLDEDREAVTSRFLEKLSVRVTVRTFMPTPKRRSSERSLHWRAGICARQKESIAG